MKKFLCLIFIFVCGCSQTPEQAAQEVKDHTTIIEMDGHEFIYVNMGMERSARIAICHRPDCKYCKQKE